MSTDRSSGKTMSDSIDDQKPVYATEAEVADYLNLALITAQTRRRKGKDWPPAYRFGSGSKAVRYKWAEVVQWAESRRIGGAK